MKLGDQPVHPTPWEDQGKPNGITLRQEFAKAAMTGMFQFLNGGSDPNYVGEYVVKSAVKWADLLLAELEKPHE